MVSSIDKRGRLSEEPFTYRITKEKKVFVSWRGKQVIILSGKKAEDFTSEIMNADDKTAQLIMAKTTGHFKHGNERMSKHRK
jgi:hypothetical protein